MKRVPEIVLFIIMSQVILTSGINENRNSILTDSEPDRETRQDTSFLNMVRVDSFFLRIYPPSSGIQFYKDGIVFLSPAKNERKMLPGQISFGAVEAYYAVPGDSSTGKHAIFSPSMHFTYPCEATTFSSDFNTMYFTMLHRKEPNEKIYMAKYLNKGKKRGGWYSDNVALDFCTGNSTYTHPALSADEQFMIFASDREGSFGGMDLYISRKEGDKWVSPKNLGTIINSKGNEFYPFLDSFNNLYFSSDGLAGYGGFDIFTCKYNGKAWESPVNLSKGINSQMDDIAFTIDRKTGKLAFFTTIEKAGEKNRQLFRVTPNIKSASDARLILSDLLYKMALADPTSRGMAGMTAFVNEVKNEEVKVAEQIVAPPTQLPPVTEKPAEIKPEPKVEQAAPKPEPVKPAVSKPEAARDAVIYRVQFSSSLKPQGERIITVNGVNYKTFEYYYVKEYRSTIGEFSTLQEAVELQNTYRKTVNSQAFVVAFRNNIRVTDPSLFK